MASTVATKYTRRTARPGILWVTYRGDLAVGFGTGVDMADANRQANEFYRLNAHWL